MSFGGNGRVGTENGFAGAVSSVAEHVRSLVRLEAELAVADVSEKAKRMGGGIALVAAAAGVGVFGVGVSIAAVAAVIALALPWWAALLIVAGVLFVTAAILALL